MKKTFYVTALLALAACTQEQAINQLSQKSTTLASSSRSENESTIENGMASMQLISRGNSKLRLEINADTENQADVWIDLNGNHQKDEGETVHSFQENSSASRPNNYITTHDTVTIYGKVTYLNCSQNELTALKVSDNPYLRELRCDNNNLTELNLQSNRKLTFLDAGVNQLSTLNLQHNPELHTAWLNDNQLEGLDISSNTALRVLNLSANKLSSFEPGIRPELTHLFVNNNPLKTLDVSRNTTLVTLECGVTDLTHLDISKLKRLKWLHCSNNHLQHLNLSQNPLLEHLNCTANALGSLDLSANLHLNFLRCELNRLTTLDCSGLNELIFISCAENQMDAAELNSFFNSLRNVKNIRAKSATDKLVDLSNNPGTATANRSIATGKGWKLFTDNKPIHASVE